MALIDKASLLMVPSTYEAGKLYNVLPSGNRAPDSTDQNSGYDQTRADFDFDRGSNAAATRVNASGLIEKYRENLLTYSNDFSNAAWGNSGAFATSGESGYDGTNNAWRLGAVNSSPYINQGSFSTLRTHSIYAKAGTYDQVSIIVGGYGQGVQFDLTSGTIAVNSNASIYYPNITSVGGGWYRISVFVTPSAPTYGFLIAPQLLAGGGISVGEYIYIQNAQSESSLVATDYLDSTSVTGKAGVLVDLPRINYDANGENGALLLEPSRANLLPYSEYFGAWNKTNQGTGSAPILSIGGNFPLGDGKYYNLQCNLNGGTTSSDRSYISLSGLSGTQFTAAKSIWIKNNSASEAVLFVGINFAADKFTLAPNADWQRITIDGGVINSEFRIGLGGGSSQSNTIDVSIFGAQCEAGSYATSYIPTMGTSETRAADSCSVTGASDVIGQTEGTLYWELEKIVDGFDYYQVSDGGTNNWILVGIDSGNVLAYIKTGGAVQVSTGSPMSVGRHKIALAYAANDVVLYLDGVQVGSDTSVSIPATNEIALSQGNPAGAKGISTKTFQCALFKERLSNAELATLTTL